MEITIKSATVSVTINTFGAEMTSVKQNGKEWVWQNTNGAWAGHGPLLFPVCGHCGMTVNGVSYPLHFHGFASKMEYAVTAQSENSVTLSLQSNDETRKVYPYEFLFKVIYTICGDKLSIAYEVENLAETPLYFGCGSHESFNLDSGDMSNYEVRFEKEEKFVTLLHDDDGYMTGESKDFGEGTTLVLPDDFLQDGDTLIFKDVQSRKVTLAEKGGKALLDVTFDGFSNLLFWRALNSPYICIEPWSNLPDPAGVPDKEFPSKQGVFKVEGFAKKHFVRTITYHA